MLLTENQIENSQSGFLLLVPFLQLEPPAFYRAAIQRITNSNNFQQVYYSI